MFPTSRARNKGIGALAALIILSVTASYVFADELASPSFNFNDSGFTQMGGFSSTSNFQQFGTLQPAADGDSSSTHFSLSSGYLYPADTSPFKQQNWQWFDDSYDGTPSIAFAPENTSPSAIPYDDPMKLRVTVNDVAGAGQANIKFRLQYSTSSDFSTGAVYVGEIGDCATTVWCYVDGAGTDNTAISETVLSDPQFCSGGIGNGCGSYNESGTSTSLFFHTAGTRKEYEFTIKQTTGIQSTVYFFRLVDYSTGTPVPLNTLKTYPSATVDGGTLSFAINGLGVGTTTEGVTTDVSTSPSNISFGALTLGASKIAAHRLTVTTNAGNGYKVYAYQRQGLLNGSAREIPPIGSTNDSPLSWSSACTSTSTGCYGYHSGQDVLEGGSTRFAADDSYAQFTSSPDEVAFGAGPASAVSTDIVYKIEVKDLQESGDYDSSIVYIATPVF